MRGLASSRKERLFLSVLSALALRTFGVPGSPALAEERWVSWGPVGGTVRTLAQAISDPGRLYAATERTGLFASRDGGRSWRSIRDGVAFGDIERIAVAPDNPDAILVATTHDLPFYQLWRSEDGGATWDRASAPPAFEGDSLQVQALAFEPNDAGTAYAATDRGIYRSEDGGATWAPWALPQISTAAIVLLPGARGSWFAVGVDALDFSGAIYRSDDRGATWRETPPSPFGQPERMFSRAGVLYAQKDGGLYRSTDLAESWTLAARLPTLQAIDFKIAPSGRIYAATFSGVYSSTDGTNWSPSEVFSTDQASPKDSISDLAILPAGPRGGTETVIAGGRRGFWRSTDLGKTWKAASRGISVHDVDSLIVLPDVLGTVLGTMDDGVYRSERNGKSWRLLSMPSGLEFPTFAADPHHPGRIYALGAFGAFGVSEDRGNSWRILSRLSNSRAYLLKVDPVHSDVIYAGILTGGGSSGEDLAYRSIDGGEHWNLIGEDGLLDVAFDPVRRNVGYRLTQAGIDRTTDGGGSWQRLPDLFTQLLGSAASAILIDSRSGALLVGTDERGVFRSTDSGRTFRRADAGLPRLPGGRRPAVGRLIEDAAGGVYAGLPYVGVFRLDPGRGWTAVNAGLPLETFVRTLVADPEVPGLIYAGSIGSSVHRLENR